MTTTNRRIQNAAEVAVVATEPEGETLDYKSSANPDEWWELAKDIAAFANHLGGVILVGATEQPDGLPNLHGLPPEKVAPLAHAYEMAAKDKCKPSALITCDRIPWDGGREMLAVNVEADAAGIVGAMFYALDAKGAPQTTNAWQFPMRVGKHNPPLPLEQAIMHMSTHARRVAILLASVPTGARVKVHLQKPERVDVPWDARLLNVSVERNSAEVRLVRDDGEEPTSHGIPLDDIETVWSDGSTWFVRISGYFEDIQYVDGRDTTEYFSRRRSKA